jgi:hypothetical protein
MCCVGLFLLYLTARVNVYLFGSGLDVTFDTKEEPCTCLNMHSFPIDQVRENGPVIRPRDSGSKDKQPRSQQTHPLWRPHLRALARLSWHRLRPCTSTPPSQSSPYPRNTPRRRRCQPRQCTPPHTMSQRSSRLRECRPTATSRHLPSRHRKHRRKQPRGRLLAERPPLLQFEPQSRRQRLVHSQRDCRPQKLSSQLPLLKKLCQQLRRLVPPELHPFHRLRQA